MYNVRAYHASEGSTLITPHFKVKEFACQDGSPIIFISKELVDLLEFFRTGYGSPLIVNSGYRTHSHNKKVGGAQNSMHMYGLAADVRPQSGSIDSFYKYVLSAANGKYGIGKYPSFVHIDVRAKPSRW